MCCSPPHLALSLCLGLIPLPPNSCPPPLLLHDQSHPSSNQVTLIVTPQILMAENLQITNVTLADIKGSKYCHSMWHVLLATPCQLPPSVGLVYLEGSMLYIGLLGSNFVYFLSPFELDVQVLHSSLACFTLDLMPLTLPHYYSPLLPLCSMWCTL